MATRSFLSEEQKKEWKMLRKDGATISEEELARCERAARQLRERLVHVPYYAERDQQQGMRYWRTLQASEYSLG